MHSFDDRFSAAGPVAGKKSVGIYPQPDTLFSQLSYTFKVMGKKTGDGLFGLWTYYSRNNNKPLIRRDIKPLSGYAWINTWWLQFHQLEEPDSVKFEIIDPGKYLSWQLRDKQDDTAFINPLVIFSKIFRVTSNYKKAGAGGYNDEPLWKKATSRSLQIGTQQFPAYNRSPDFDNALSFKDQFSLGQLKGLKSFLIVYPGFFTDKDALEKVRQYPISAKDFINNIAAFKIVSPLHPQSSFRILEMKTSYCDEIEPASPREVFFMTNSNKTEKELEEYNKEKLKERTNELVEFINRKAGYALVQFNITARQEDTGMENEFIIIIKVQ